ncbi:hypothetical protein Q5H93_02430 [Hymenobacter sp. ASUV-10]|uniref:Lipoprotein n=1 Tax=Hymenobacter aranciens TaxID=3063996 RepID=A0ABT9B5W5_9BACT|nr:hypothetical protein [Hymenobacter sp. ASUV-10]MDO7873573.1 hypothetical protein [Hymenobacter sp. ASUV-10]
MRTMTIGLLVSALLIGLSTCNNDTPVNTSAADFPRATATVAQPLATVRAHIFAALQGKDVPLQVLSHPELGPQFDDFVLYTNEQQRIDYEFRQLDKGGAVMSSDEVPMNLDNEPPATITPALREFITLPVPGRTADLLMQRGRGPFWSVPEYHDAQNQPLPYTCDHLVHFTAQDEERTQIEIISLNSYVQDGKEWRLSAGQDGLGLPWPRRMPRSRDVLPSVTDQQQVLAQLVKLAEQP